MLRAWLLAAALLVGVYMVWVGGLPMLVLGLASLACAVLYTGGPFPLAYYGLGDLFVAVEIVSEKDRATYDRVFARHGTGAAEAVMAGNSMKSDVLPAIAAGAFGVHIPYHVTWAHELADAPVNEPRYVSLARIDELPDWIAAIGNG